MFSSYLSSLKNFAKKVNTRGCKKISKSVLELHFLTLELFHFGFLGRSFHGILEIIFKSYKEPSFELMYRVLFFDLLMEAEITRKFLEKWY